MEFVMRLLIFPGSVVYFRTLREEALAYVIEGFPIIKGRSFERNYIKELLR